ncbi:MAG: hypothetical protein SPD90_13955 [Intestinibacter sp.]|uniref:hypothetical protein n=1 Tax=Intestinibacter sp. TaxID=1965304 RepID=UPI002A81BD34|nr:hypothetical protein [Intestinibacter sp.]MDY4576149.1 hypothetical protein [Intestinibacter sp.]
MKEKLARFMQGRYGNDQLNNFLMKAFLVEFLLYFLLRGVSRGLSAVMYYLGFATIIYVYYRLFSRNIYKRASENQAFLNKTANIRSKINSQKSIMKQRKTHRIYKCPTCKQKVRVPKGKGKISIHCPKCDTYFIKRS